MAARRGPPVLAFQTVVLCEAHAPHLASKLALFPIPSRANAHKCALTITFAPTGDPSPSTADIKVTRDLMRAGQLLNIELLDHVIIGREHPDRPKGYASLRELGIFAA
jgi:hypothetical protein